MTESPTSPRISSLKQQLDAGNTPALDAFWREIEVEGAPLIEQIEGDDQHVLVTFLWREEEPVKHVIVAGELVGDDVHNNRLQRLGNKLPHLGFEETTRRPGQNGEHQHTRPEQHEGQIRIACLLDQPSHTQKRADSTNESCRVRT